VHLTLRPWDDFTMPAKYSVPTDVNTLLDRMRTNVSYYAANYLALAGAILAIGIVYNFGVFFTLLLALSAGYGAWFGLMTYVPQMKPNSIPILGASLLVTFYIGLKLVGEEYAMVVWQYFIFALLPGLVHALFKKRNPINSAVNKASNAVKDIKRELRQSK